MFLAPGGSHSQRPVRKDSASSAEHFLSGATLARVILVNTWLHYPYGHFLLQWPRGGWVWGDRVGRGVKKD